MKTIISTLSLFLALVSSARADGFKCVGQSTGLKIKVFNHTDPRQGTRTASVMLISNPMIRTPNQTVAKFSDQNRTLKYLGHGQYTAKVDLRFNDSGRQGENIAGTKLGELSSIDLFINFSYSHNSIELANAVPEIPGTISYIKRNGEVLEEPVICSRYLKN
jgi:hypothetical protein